MTSIIYRIKSIKRVILYGLVGVLAFLSEYFSFIFLINIITIPYPLIIAQSISFGFGLIVSFTGSRLFTFNDANKTYVHNVSRQIVAYAILTAINFCLSNLIIYMLVNYFLISPFIAKIVVMLMVVLWNFLIFNKLIFKSKTVVS